MFKLNFQNNNHSIGVAVTHLDHKSEELREKQIRQGIQQTEKQMLRELSHVVCGDFNTFQKSDCSDISWNNILNLYAQNGWPEPMEKSLVLEALREKGYEDTYYNSVDFRCRQEEDEEAMYPQPTAWTNRPLMRIDHVFLKNCNLSKTQFEVKSHCCGSDFEGSDHFPIAVDLQILEE